MVVSTAATTCETITTHTGTLAEVVQALETAGVNTLKETIIYYNGTNITAVHMTRGS